MGSRRRCGVRPRESHLGLSRRGVRPRDRASVSMRFCMVTTFYPPYHFGGDGILVYHLSNELARRGHEVEVIHSIDAYRLFVKEPGGDAPPHHPGVTVHGLESTLGFVSPLAAQQTGLPVFTRRPIERILRRGFDVV